MPAQKKKTTRKSPAKKVTKKVAKKAVKKVAKKKAPVKKPVKKTARKKVTAKKTTTRRSPAKRSTSKKVTTRKAPAKKTAAKKSALKKPAAKKKTTKRPAPKKTVAKRVAPKKAPKRTPVKKVAKAAPKKATKSLTNRKVSATRTAATLGPLGIKPYHVARGEDYMNEDQTRHFRNILDVWKKQLMEEVDRTVHHMQDEVSSFPDPLDRASQEEKFNLELRTRDRERKFIRKIDESLHNIKGGDYGFCGECGAEIGIRRLEARPTATQCIECKTIAEIRERQTRG